MTDYALLEQQTAALIADEPDVIANLANISALLMDGLQNINWVGFYIVKEDQLVLGPFQGKPACVRIPIGKGVCGTAVALKSIQCIEDVHAFAGHIACDSASNSEIVLPIMDDNKVYGVLDIDSPRFSRFDKNDVVGLSKIVQLIENYVI
ncbi:MAG: GAF domain-containing protein [Alteromonadaceae bacterium]|nr:GAF domain-containing protein [Alteromonadaceae bacterium]